MTSTIRDKMDLVTVAQPTDLYDGVARSGCIPQILADVPMLSRLSDLAPGYYRLGIIHIHSEALERPRRYGFVKSPWDPPMQGESYLAAIDEEHRRYRVLAQVTGEIPSSTSALRRNLWQLVGQL